MATLTTTQPPPGGLSLDFLPHIDMTTLSQSELRSLSLCSSSSTTSAASAAAAASMDSTSAYIDRSSFNESTGSRRQTYSRPSHHHHRHRLAAPLPKKTAFSPDPPPSSSTSSSTDHPENRAIISFLKRLLSSDPNFQQPPDLSEFEMFSHHFNLNPNANGYSYGRSNSSMAAAAPERKRKRGRKAKVKLLVSAEETERAMGVGIVNRNGAAVDLDWLAGLEDPFKEVLMERTAGLKKEEDLLGFLRDLGGQWCSRRRKRRIVDASEFGDVLPVGWKLILGLKRKEGRAWVYCRRYISPGGQHFVSCKEVSEYLRSFIGSSVAKLMKDYATDSVAKEGGVVSESFAGAIQRVDEDHTQANQRQKEVSLLEMEMDNLEEVRIQDLFECHKCLVTFEDKDTYLQHLLSFHQKTTRRYKIGSSVGNGVIVKDGKYECQFCHKVFHERRRYNGHVGIHVRNYVRGIEESPEVRMALQNVGDPQTTDELPSRISKMDALIEIAQSTIQQTASSGLDGLANGGLNSDNHTGLPNSELPASLSDHELNSDSPVSEADSEDDMNGEQQEPELDQQKGDLMEIDGKMEKISDAIDVLDAKMDPSSAQTQHGDESETIGIKDVLAHSSGDLENSGVEQERGSEGPSAAPFSNQELCDIEKNMNLVDAERPDLPKPDELDRLTNIEIEVGFGIHRGLIHSNMIQETVDRLFEESVTEDEVPEPPELHSQPFLEMPHEFSIPNTITDRGEDEFGSTDPRHDEETGVEELRLEEIEKLKFSLGAGQEAVSLQEVPLKNDEIEGTYDTSGQFESEVIGEMTSGQQFTTVCVWCGVEFSHEADDAEMQSDSVGYMCPSCKAKISGQLNVLDTGS
ncbi:hypothetical protein Tsubulata_032974 [Turnera subulata]|uniref:C2H2-type domain-containing protein n=1 Tax=Turnera subulata TaxID=218843 RepID=A0A9Q0F9P2_9ROSI|nr:hypothetical protein Tsubulata_032974 [Turnera subulata]